MKLKLSDIESPTPTTSRWLAKYKKSCSEYTYKPDAIFPRDAARLSIYHYPNPTEPDTRVMERKKKSWLQKDSETAMYHSTE